VKKLENVYQVDAFTKEPFNGNSAAIVFGYNLADEEMKQIAKEMNLSETAFITSSDNADYRLRWFTPAVEVELCGHATIASIHYLTERGIIKNSSSVTFETLSGIINCRTENGKYFMQIPVPEFEEFKGNLNGALNALGLKPKDLDTAYSPLLQNNGNLFIYVKKLDTIGNLKPHFTELVRLSTEEKEFTEVTVFSLETLEKGSHAHLRFFAPYYGINEDPVTGSANGPLLMALRKLGLVEQDTENKIFNFEQGDFVNRKGRINVTYSPVKDELFISGNAVTILRGELIF
jgi:trans-2,3-dihydro-3-hydroxyanthranilate isomerase